MTIVNLLSIISLEISKRAIECHLCMFEIGVEKKVWTFLPILNLLFLRGKPFFSQMKIKKGMLKKA